MTPVRAVSGASNIPFGRAYRWTVTLVAICLAGAATLAIAPLGPLSAHMSVHILLMNAVAPAIAVATLEWPRAAIVYRAARSSLVLASIAQIGVLWIAHSPPLMAASMSSYSLHVVIQVALLATALWFWFAVLGQSGAARWRAIVALLLTGKLFCLLAALLVFAPRALYPTDLVHVHHGTAADPLADQYLAGLLMLVVCPLTYVLAGVLIAARWLRELRERDAILPPLPWR
jgi:putative membrane protein